MTEEQEKTLVLPRIAAFYAGLNVLIMGGTGFVGKVLLEKLLRSCPEIDNIFVLVRPEKETDPVSRITDLLNSPIFDTLKRQQPDQLNKIILIYGEFSGDDLDIGSQDKYILREVVSIVFYVSSTMILGTNVEADINVKPSGIENFITFCRSIKQLRAFVYVSPVFSVCDFNTDVIREVIQLSGNAMDKCAVCSLNDHMDKEPAKEISAEGLPAVIIRTTIVAAALKEPAPGWVDRRQEPTALMSQCAGGTLCCLFGREDYVADLVPVDLLVNLMIVAACWRSLCLEITKCKVFTFCSADQNPITWGNFANWTVKYARQYPFEILYWYPSMKFYQRRFIYWLHSFVSRVLPLIVDQLKSEKRQSLRNVHQQRNLILKYADLFLLKEHVFSDQDVRILCSVLHPDDRYTFPFDVKSIDWQEYVRCYVMGIRQFLLRQKEETLPESRQLLKRMKRMHQFTRVLYISLCAGTIYLGCAFLNKFLHSIINWLLNLWYKRNVINAPNLLS